MGLIFVFDRETGKPLFPIEERTVSVEGAVIGEKLSPTQPFPKLPKPFFRHHLTINDLNSLLGDSIHLQLQQIFYSLNYKRIFTPPPIQLTIFFPVYYFWVHCVYLIFLPSFLKIFF